MYQKKRELYDSPVIAAEGGAVLLFLGLWKAGSKEVKSPPCRTAAVGKAPLNRGTAPGPYNKDRTANLRSE